MPSERLLTKSKILLVTSAFVFLLPGTVSAKDRIKTFSAPLDKVFDAAVQIAKVNYTLQSVDRQEHILVFHTEARTVTYGTELTVTMFSESTGKTTVKVRAGNFGQHWNDSSQIFGIGKDKRTSDKFLERLQAQLEHGPTTVNYFEGLKPVNDVTPD